MSARPFGVKARLAQELCGFTGSPKAFREKYNVADKGQYHRIYTAEDIRRIRMSMLSLSEDSSREKTVPPILNFVEPDLECDLPLVTNSPEVYQATHVLANSFAFGGLNVALLFGIPASR